MAATKRIYVPEPVKSRRVFVSYPKILITLAALVAVVGAALIAIFFSGSPAEKATRAMVKAYGKRRLIEMRLSGGFTAAQYNPDQTDRSGVDEDALRRAHGLVAEALSSGDDGWAELAHGRLLTGGGKAGQLALKQLRSAAARLPKSAEAHNDLGVCLVERGRIEEALDQFNLALDARGRMPEALFNRALCYQRLQLRDEAQADLERLEALEPQGAWTVEARQKQQELSPISTSLKKSVDIISVYRTAIESNDLHTARRIIDDHFEIMYKYASTNGIRDYLQKAATEGKQKAANLLAGIEAVGKRTFEARGDTLISDIAAYLRDLGEKDVAAEFALATRYSEAEKLWNAKRYAEAQEAFRQLSQAFAARGNDAAQFCAIHYLSACYYSDNRLLLSKDALKEALAILGRHNWPYHRATVAELLGIIYARLGQDSLAISLCEQALEDGRGNRIHEAKSLQYMSVACWHLGDLDGALKHLRKSTGIYLAYGLQESDLANNYLHIADIYRLRGNHTLAMLNAKQALSFARMESDYNRMAQSLSFAAVEEALLGRFDEAQQQLEQATESLEKIPEAQRGFTRPLILTRGGELAARRKDYRHAIESYSKAIAQYEKNEDKQIPLIRVLRGRAEVYAEGKEFEKARLDLERAISLIEDYRTHIAESENRSEFLDASQSVFDQMILLNVNGFGRKAEAFDYSEQSRARSLLDEFSLLKSAKPAGDNASQTTSEVTTPKLWQVPPRKLAEVRGALPEGLRLIAYSVTSKGTLIFLVTRDGIEVTSSPATTEELDRMVNDYVSALKEMAPIDELSEKAYSLYNHLIAPVEAGLRDGKSLCIIPDKALHFLPFAALVDGAGRYLIESHTLTYAPSASALLKCIEEERLKTTRAIEKILAVGNPSFNRARFSELRDLPDAEREASESAAFYESKQAPAQNVLTGARATEQQVRAALKDCDVAHLALHCLVEEKSPWRAALVLADSNRAGAPLDSLSKLAPGGADNSSEDGMLQLSEIYGFSLPRTRLVVLSACQSGLGKYYRGEGIVSLVRPFLALKVPTVVASLWSVDSQATATLMIDFHKERKTIKSGAGDSLRAAQVSMARGGSYQHPFYWAPFITVGSNGK